MIQFTTKPGTTVLAIVLPNESKDYEIINGQFYYFDTVEWSRCYIDLPPSQWQFINTLDKITLSQAIDLIETMLDEYDNMWYKSYQGIQDDEWLPGPIDSLRSAIKANVGNPDSVYAILVNKNEK